MIVSNMIFGNSEVAGLWVYVAFFFIRDEFSIGSCSLAYDAEIGIVGARHYCCGHVKTLRHYATIMSPSNYTKTHHG
jgi:hypothetical protein